jgi:hypothetical protein
VCSSDLEGAVERVAEAHAVADLHNVERGDAVALTALVALGVGGATDGDAHEDWRLLRELHGEALGDAELERVKRGDPLGGPLAELRIVLLPLAVIPDAVEKGDNDTLRVPDAQRVAVLDGDAHAEARALLDAQPEGLGEAAIERDAEAHAEAVPHAVGSGVAVTLAVLAALEVGPVDGEAQEDGGVLCEEQEDALSDAELEREGAGLKLGGMLDVCSGEAEAL